jgi:hypothetical protein
MKYLNRWFDSHNNERRKQYDGRKQVSGDGQEKQTHFRWGRVEPGLVAELVEPQDPSSAICQEQPDG